MKKKTIKIINYYVNMFYLAMGIALIFVSSAYYFIGYHNVDLMVNAMTWNNCSWDDLWDVHNSEGDYQTARYFYSKGNEQMREGYLMGLAGMILIGFYLGGKKCL